MKYKLFFIVLSFIVTGAQAQTTTENYVKTTTVRVVGKKTTAEVSALSNTQKNVSITYYDGLGRPIQQVQQAGSPLLKDIVLPIAYDALGRQDKDYLPYVASTNTGVYQSNWTTAQPAFYATSTTSDKIANSTVPFSEKIFEASPLGRVMEQGFADVIWRSSTKGGGGKTVKTDYLINIANQVRQWDYNSATRGVSTLQFYPAGELQYVQTTDENGNMVQQFQDKLDRMVLKRVQDGGTTTPTWTDTYYVYDDFGNLVCVLPPLLISTLGTNTNLLPNGADKLLKNLAFQYRYDGRQRLISKKVPGAGWVEMVYDQWDRLVLTQDSVQRTNNEYSYTKYNYLNRPIMTGIWGSTLEIGTLRDQVMAHAQRYENKITSGIGYTLDLSYPTGATDENKVYTATYYDDYTLQSTWGTSFGFVSELGYGITSDNEMVKGQVTGSQIRVLGTNTLLKNVTYYDSKYRPIQTISEHIKTGRDRVSHTYDFVGQITQTLRTHVASGQSTVTIKERFEYDHAGRMLKHFHTMNGQTEFLMSEMKYNEIGELVEKNLHSENGGSTNLQSVDYRYNIRGWLSSINNQKLDNLTGINDDTNDLFGMELYYNTRPSGVTQSYQYNGNITAIKWGNVDENGLKSAQVYGYGYDKLNRLTNSYSYTGSTTLTVSNNNREYGISYDKNGNITKLFRTNSAGVLVDSLIYNYGSGASRSNQLLKVSDKAGAQFDELFKNGANTSNDYAYDGNGNMKWDRNKEIYVNSTTPAITYNYLNLPQQVITPTVTVNYTYDATGQKLKKVAGTTTTEYIGGIHYENNSLTFIQTAEGRVRKSGSVWVYEYDLKDHLGNVRVSFRKSATGTAELLQKDDYYPFGLTFNSFSSGAENLYKFTGKEEQKEWGVFDYGARMYEPALGRWMVIDPLAHKYPSLSPYCFVANNPLIYVDPDGREIKLASEVVDGKTVITVTVTGKLINESGTAYTQEQLQSYTDRLVSSIASTYTGSDGDVSWKGVANITVATDDNKLSATDHAFRIVDKDKIPDGNGGFASEGTLGRAPLGENVVYLSQHMLDRTQATEGEYAGTGKTTSGTGTLERTGPHEIGHSAKILTSNTGGGTHPTPGTMDGNLMHQTLQPNAGTKLTKGQILEIQKRYDAVELNKGKQK